MWLQRDPNASWEKLACALAKIGCDTMADQVRHQFVAAAMTTTRTDRTTKEKKIRSEFVLMTVKDTVMTHVCITVCSTKSERVNAMTLLRMSMKQQ